MLVGDDDAAELLDVAADLLEPPPRLARPEAGVDQDAGAVALEVVGVACAAGAERGDDHRIKIADVCVERPASAGRSQSAG